MSTAVHPERAARAVLTTLIDSTDAEKVSRGVAKYGPVETLERLNYERAWGSRSPSLNDAAALLESASSVGATLLCPGDSAWPAGLDALNVTSAALWVRGPVEALSSGPVTVTGSRSSTAYGEYVANDLGSDLANRNVPIACGLSFGIDASAAGGAVRAGGTVIGVLASGVDRVYPAAHTSLFARVLDQGGVLVSPHAPGSAPTRVRFLNRYRVMAALSRAVVVVEAAQRSSVKVAIETATQTGVPVGAIPGPVVSTSSSLTNQMIADGTARLVTSGSDVLAIIGEV